MSAAPLETWRDSVDRRARLLYHQIAAMQRLIEENGGGDELLSQACAPYEKLLNELQKDDLPLAAAIDDSDLLLHLDGPGVQTKHPRLALVTSVFGDVRKQMSSIIKLIATAVDESITLPKEIDFGLTSFRQGSLYLGFSLPEPDAGAQFLSGDPLVAASRQSLLILGQVTSWTDRDDGLAEIQNTLPDPRLRDAALAAVERLAPSGRRGIDRVDLTGRCMPDTEWRRLTVQTRQRVRAWLAQSVRGSEEMTLTGLVRGIDLDARRFDLRQIREKGLPDLRCVYGERFDRAAKTWLDRTVSVRGRVEFYQDKPRLMEIMDAAPAEEDRG